MEIAPKKTVVSLRRSKQFAQIEPTTRTRVDVGLNLPGEPAERAAQGDDRDVHAQDRSDRRQTEVDDELVELMRRAYALAGPR